MKIFRLLTIAVLLTASMTSCKGGSAKTSGSKADTPKAMTEVLWEKIQKGKYDAAVDYWVENTNFAKDITRENAGKVQMLIAGLMDGRRKQDEANGGIQSIEVEDEEIDEDRGRATVMVQLNFANGKSNRFRNDFSKDAEGNWKFGNKMQGN